MTSGAVSLVSEITQTFAGLEDIFQLNAPASKCLAHAAQLAYCLSNAGGIAAAKGREFSHRPAMARNYETLSLLHPFEQLGQMGLRFIGSNFRHRLSYL